MPTKHLAIELGNLRKPIHLLVRTDTQDLSGGETDAAGGSTVVGDIGGGTYTDLFGVTVWANDEHKKSSSIEEGGKLVTSTYHTYTVRFHPSIIAGIYIVDPYFANKLYVQGVVDPDGERHWLQLTAQEVEG